MFFGEIENDVCINAIVFKTKEEAMKFDDNLVEIPEGYGIGDTYNGEWIKKTKTEEEVHKQIKDIKINSIKAELIQLDTTINRATEDLYTLTDLKAYDTIEAVITRKEELREELKNLTKVGG